MAKKALVTGACGFCGSHMVELLVKEGWEVRATDLPSADGERLKNLGLDFEKLGVEFVPSDLTQKDTLKPVLEGVDYLFNPAALFDYFADWETMERVNVGGMENFCEIIAQSDIKRMIHWSTIDVYGMINSKDLPMFEDSPKNPENNYQKSKWQQEEVVRRFYEEKKLPVSIIRPAPIYGPRNKYGVFQIIESVAKAQVPGVPKDGKNYMMPFAHVKDVCQSAIFLSQNDETTGEAYNIVDDSMLSYYETIHLFGLLTNTKIIDFVGVSMEMTKNLMVLLAKMDEWVSRRKGRKHAKMEVAPMSYIGTNYFISNMKIKEAGCKFLYPDARIGFKETIEWYYRMGWL